METQTSESLSVWLVISTYPDSQEDEKRTRRDNRPQSSYELIPSGATISQWTGTCLPPARYSSQMYWI